MDIQKLINYCRCLRIQHGCEGCPFLTKPEGLCLFQEYPFPNDWGKYAGFQVGFSLIEKSHPKHQPESESKPKKAEENAEVIED